MKGKAINTIEEKYNNLNQTIEELEKRYSKNIQRYLIVIEKTSGVAIFRHSFTEQKIDSDLISGFLTAIQSFGAELTTKEASMKKLAYKDFEIELNMGRYVWVALILAGPISKLIIHNLAQFNDSFEQTYEEALRGWYGDVSKFADATQLVYLYFLA